jgi:hypothetical protein
MKVAVLLFCFGTGMLQNAMQRSSLRMTRWLYVVFQVVPIAATIAELIFAFRAFRWWGFLICYGFFLLPDFINRERWRNDPQPFFVIGLSSVTIAAGLIYWL